MNLNVEPSTSKKQTLTDTINNDYAKGDKQQQLLQMQTHLLPSPNSQQYKIIKTNETSGGPVILNISSRRSSAAPSVSRSTTRLSKTQLDVSTKLLKDSLLQDDRYRAKQLKKQRKLEIQKRFSELQHLQKSTLNSGGGGPGTYGGVNSNNNKIKSGIKNNESKNVAGSGGADVSYKVPRCQMTFIFDPNGRLSYWMGFIVSLAFLYNFWVIVYRFSFNEINSKNKFYWFTFDYFADLLYVFDIMFNFRTGFLEEGVLQTDPIRLRHHYMNTTRFYVDCLCLMPLDILYLSVGYNSIFRCFRLVKIYRFWTFLDRTERHTNFPNLFRTVVMLHYLFAIFHWNACFSYFISRYLSEDLMVRNYNQAFSHTQAQTQQANNLSSFSHESTTPAFFINNEYNSNSYFTKSFANDDEKGSKYASSKHQQKISTSLINEQELMRDYLKALYFSTKIMTLVSEMPNPKTSSDYLFAIFQLIFALLLFAAIMGHVGYIVSNLGNARKEFQSKLDAVKTYMLLRRVPQRLQDRVIRWFDFLWTNHKSTDDNQILNLLPYKLRAEIAIHVHLDTLKRVEIFQNTEAGFLNELVLRLKPVLYSPGDYICRKGEVGKEMYIVNGGRLQVISDNGKIVLATLKAGSYFGEISILNMGSTGNRRTASVKSVGYSDLFCLSKEDLWEVLKEYPAVRVKLEAIAVKRLEKHKKPLSEIVNLKRCKSSPCLLDPNMKKFNLNQSALIKRHGTLPTSLLKRTDLSYLFASSKSKPSMSKIALMEQSVAELVHKKNLEIFETFNKNTHFFLQDKHAQQASTPQNQLPASYLNQSIVNEQSKNDMTKFVHSDSLSLTHPSTPSSLNINSFNSNIFCKTSTSTNSQTGPNQAAFKQNRAPSIQSSDVRSTITYEDSQTYNDKTSVNLQQIDNCYLIREIERLRNCIYYLEGENLTLNLKMDKMKLKNKSQQHINQYQMLQYQQSDVEMKKAKQESDLDDNK